MTGLVFLSVAHKSRNRTNKNLLLVHNHYRIPGGEDTVVSNEYALLKSMGHTVTLYERHNDEIAGMTGFQRLALPFTFICSKKTAKEITSIIKEKHIDVILVHNTLSLISPSVYYAAKKAGIPVLQTIHNFRLICPKATLYRDGHICEDCVKKGLHCALLHRCYRNSLSQTLVAVISAMIHRKTGIYSYLHYICLTSFNRDRLLTLPSIIKTHTHIKPNFTAVQETIVPYKDRENTFIYAGRLEEQKGTKELLNAWYLLETGAKNHEDIPTLDIYGTGPETDYAQKYIEKHGLRRVNLHNPLPHADIIKTIGKTRALILPTKWYEGFPMTIAEAFGAGTPVIGTDLGNTGDLIKNTVEGSAKELNKNTVDEKEADHTRTLTTGCFTPLGALIDPADMEVSLAHIIEAWDSFTYDIAAFKKAAQKYGEEENRRIFTEILTKITKKQ